MTIKAAVEEFAERLKTLLEGEAVERARAAVLRAIGVQPTRKPGRPPATSTKALAVARKPRRKPPRQPCPVPGCENAAAPIFGMFCAKHKDVAKLKIRTYREARKGKKLGEHAAATKTTKRRSRKAVVKKAKPAPETTAVPNAA